MGLLVPISCRGRSQSLTVLNSNGIPIFVRITYRLPLRFGERNPDRVRLTSGPRRKRGELGQVVAGHARGEENVLVGLRE
jgi:hypothetical protein